MPNNLPPGCTSADIDALSAPAGYDSVSRDWEPRCACDRPCHGCGGEGYEPEACNACRGDGYDSSDAPCHAERCVDGKIECRDCSGSGSRSSGDCASCRS